MSAQAAIVGAFLLNLFFSINLVTSGNECGIIKM